MDFPSFWEGLSLRQPLIGGFGGFGLDFPSFWEGLSLRLVLLQHLGTVLAAFPFLLGRAFIEGSNRLRKRSGIGISLPFRRDFH